ILDQVMGNHNRLKELQSQTANLSGQRNAMNQKLSLLYDDRIKGIVSEQQFIQLKAGFDKEYRKIEESLATLQDKIAVLENEKKDKKSIEELIEKYCSFNELTYEMVSDFIDYIEVGEKDPDTGKQEIKIHWNL
ncbi:MAG: DUF4368 domain-containing protein, partial [Lachnospiraceae bacterium]|nr:DUF4368 domain-containing protein [Lachnospiraceae bacterium]